MQTKFFSRVADSLMALLDNIRNYISGIGRNNNKRYYKQIIKGKNNKLITNAAKITLLSIEIRGNDNTVIIGRDSSINNLEIYIRGNGNSIVIGENCRFVKGGSLWIEDDGCSIQIGESTSFISAHLAATENGSSITIGRDCMFAYDIDVRTGDSHSIIDASTHKRINPAASISIGNHVWVAAHVTILKGVDIGDDCVIGTGSLVTKSFNAGNVIYAGNPAKIVKQNITWTRDRL